MLVDDDVELCQEMAEILLDAGYQVESAPNGSLAKARLGVKGYDLVILDYKMSVSDGMEVLRFVKEKGLHPRIFLVSGRPFIEKIIKENGLGGMVERIINKPFNIVDLLTEIKKLK
ncbi:MAG: response regulator [Candidatus Omnitrophota bacterium]